MRDKISDLEKILSLKTPPVERSLRLPLPMEWQLDLKPLPTFSYHPSSFLEFKDQLLMKVLKNLAPYTDLQSFTHSYWVEGLSSAITQLGSTSDPIYYHHYDYSWLKSRPHFKPVKCLADVPQNACFYISQPFSALCRYIDLSELNSRPDLQIFVDLAFWGTMPPEPLNLPRCTKWIGLSFSKNLGLWPYRIGLVLTVDRWEALQAYDEALYLPLIGMQAVDRLLQNRNLFSLQETLRPHQIKICKELNLIPCASVIAGQETVWSYRTSLAYQMRQATLKTAEAPQVD